VAITFVNAGAEGSAASGNISLGAPASPQNGDIWLAVVHSSDQVAHTMLVTDWTQVAQGNGGGTTSRISVWWHRYNGATPDLTVTHITGQSPIGGIAAFRGCVSSGSPVDTVSAVLTGNAINITFNAVTPTAANCMIVAAFGAADDNTVGTNVGWTVLFEDTAGSAQNCYTTTAGNPDGMAGAHAKVHTTGSITPPLVSQTASDPWASVTVALKPDPNITVALTTQTAMGASLGTIGSEASAVLTGEAAGTALGTVTYEEETGIEAALTGSAAATALGSATPSVTIALTGHAAATAQQSLGLASRDFALVGHSNAVDQGTLTHAIERVLSGFAVATGQGTTGVFGSTALNGGAISVAQGTVSPVIEVIVALTGSTLSLSQGALALAAREFAISGHETTATLGSVTSSREVPVSGHNMLIMGQGFVATGNDVIVALTGVALSSALGSVVPGISTEITGQAATVSLGVPGAGFSLALSGTAVATTQGTISVESNNDVTVALTGHSAVVAQGSYGKFLSLSITGHNLTIGLSGVGILENEYLTFGSGPVTAQLHTGNVIVERHNTVFDIIPGGGVEIIVILDD
jgi:hypothetical protein